MRYAVERKRAEQEVQHAHERTERLLASIPSILIGVSQGGVIVHWNEVAEAIFGIAASEAIGRPISSCGVEWDAESILECVRRCGQVRQAAHQDGVRFRRSDGCEGWLGITVVPIRDGAEGRSGWLIFGADISARKQAEAERTRLQEQLAHAQKMEIIGRFAGGIAHDFHNFLQVILGFAWLIRSRHRQSPELMSDLQEIVHASESAAAMVRQLLAFGRRQVIKPKVFEANRAIQDVARLLQQLVGERIQVVLELASSPMLVRLDPTGLEQILMNLCSNARDSMPHGGTLALRTSEVVIDAAFAQAHSSAKPGRYVRLSVQDTGTGMDPSVAAHIFEPFFTTKPMDRGTGLGLAVVYGLVRQHDGAIDVETAPGNGTTFHLFFPQQPCEAARADGAPEASREASASRGAEAVLIVGGALNQRELDGQMLRDSGYEIAGACEASEVQEWLARHDGRVDAMILDGSLSAPGGPAIVERLLTLRPAMRVLLVSGGLDDRLRAIQARFGHVRVLQAPYAPAQLLDRLRQVLDEPAVSWPPTAPAADDGESSGKRRILIVDDDASIRSLCEQILQKSCEVTTVFSGRSALEALRHAPYDLLLTDIKMPEMDGLALIDAVTKSRPELKVMAMTGSLDPELEQRLRAASLLQDVLYKPFTPTDLQEAVSRCL